MIRGLLLVMILLVGINFASVLSPSWCHDLQESMKDAVGACPNVTLKGIFLDPHPDLTIETLFKRIQYHLAWRFERLWPKMWIWLIFGLAALIDGLTVARMGAYGFRYPSPIGYLTGIWLFGLSSLGLMVLPLIPVVLPMPCFEVMALGLASGLMLSARNLQKRL